MVNFLKLKQKQPLESFVMVKLPESKDYDIPGKIKYIEENDDYELEIIRNTNGSLISLFKVENYKIIHAKNVDGEILTLYNLFNIKSNGTYLKKEVYKFHHMLVSKDAFRDYEKLEVIGCNFSIKNLEKMVLKIDEDLDVLNNKTKLILKDVLNEDVSINMIKQYDYSCNEIKGTFKYQRKITFELKYRKRTKVDVIREDAKKIKDFFIYLFGVNLIFDEFKLINNNNFFNDLFIQLPQIYKEQKIRRPLKIDNKIELNFLKDTLRGFFNEYNRFKTVINNMQSFNIYESFIDTKLIASFTSLEVLYNSIIGIELEPVDEEFNEIRNSMKKVLTNNNFSEEDIKKVLKTSREYRTVHVRDKLKVLTENLPKDVIKLISNDYYQLSLDKSLDNFYKDSVRLRNIFTHERFNYESINLKKVVVITNMINFIVDYNIAKYIYIVHKDTMSSIIGEYKDLIIKLMFSRTQYKIINSIDKLDSI